MLDVGPIHVAFGESKILFDRFPGIARVADDQSLHYIHLISVKVSGRRERGILPWLPVFRVAFLGAG
jgi:hypothetical protein